jgi:hypothetical protein
MTDAKAKRRLKFDAHRQVASRFSVLVDFTDFYPSAAYEDVSRLSPEDFDQVFWTFD